MERLFGFHNEHLIVIPRLCFAALSFVFMWDNRAECWFTFLLTAILFLLICLGAFPEKERRSFWVAVALLAKRFLAFATAAAEVPLTNCGSARISATPLPCTTRSGQNARDVLFPCRRAKAADASSAGCSCNQHILLPNLTSIPH